MAKRGRKRRTDHVERRRLARAIGADDGGEVLEGPDDLVAAVGLEVAELDANEWHRENAARWWWLKRTVRTGV